MHNNYIGFPIYQFLTCVTFTFLNQVNETRANENTSNKSSKKRKRSSRELPPVKDTTYVPKLNRDISVSDMLTGLGLGVASSSRSRNDQFREPHIEEMPDMYDDELLFDLGDEENNELIDDLEEHRDDNGELIDDQEEEEDDDDDVEYMDADNEAPEDDDNLFAAPELEGENEDYDYGTELEDKLDVEILLWLFKFQQRYRIPDTALEALIKFLNYTLMMIDDSKFCEFPTSLFLAKKKLGIFQPKLRMAVCTNCHKLYDSKIVCNNKEDNKLAIMHCRYEEYPNNPVLSRKNLCNNELSSLKRNMKNMVAIPRMLYPKPTIKQQLSILYRRSNFEKMLDQSGTRNYDSNIYADIYDGKVWNSFPFDGSKFFSPETATTNLGLLINLDWFQPFKYTQHSTGAIYASICNLPRAERNKPENIIYLGFLPGPKEADKNQINHYLSPIVDELKELWEGWRVPETYENKDGLDIRVAIIVGSSDIPATRKLFGHGSAVMKCHRCPKRSRYSEKFQKTHYGGMYDYEQWITESADPEEHRQYAQEWLRCDTRGTRDNHFKKHGVRWSELLRLPYMDPIRFAVVDPMHCLFLGVAKWIIQSIFIKEKKLNSEQLRVAQRRMDSVQLPSDIGRIPPKIAIGEGFSKLTADQWKTFIMIYATTILWDMFDDNDRKILGHFVRACNLLVARFVTEDDLQEAQERLRDMSINIERTYGPEFITSNIHLSMHIPECIRDYGSVYSFWLFPYERLNGYIGKATHIGCTKL
jgi:hypothetical protein